MSQMYRVGVQADLQNIERLAERFNDTASPLEDEAVFAQVVQVLLSLVQKYNQERRVLNPNYNKPAHYYSAHGSLYREQTEGWPPNDRTL